jgi:hypothetical protein
MRLEWILLLVALMAFTYNFVHQQPITLSFDVKNPLSPEEPTFTAQATTNLGPLKLSYSTSWGRSLSSKLGFDMELKPKESWVEVQFTTDSLQGILVRQGQTIEEGELIGVHSLEVQEQLRQLEANLAKEQDELIKAELQAKIKELREKNEVHALVSGWIGALWVEQVEDLLTVHLRVVLGGEKS